MHPLPFRFLLHRFSPNQIRHFSSDRNNQGKVRTLDQSQNASKQINKHEYLESCTETVLLPPGRKSKPFSAARLQASPATAV